MKEFLEVIDNIEGQELERFTLLLLNVGRFSVTAIFLLAFTHLYVLYTRAKRYNYPVNRNGIVFIMFGVLMWFLMAASRLFILVDANDLTFQLFFSTFNNGFLLASLPFIGNGFQWIRRIKFFRNRLIWVISVLIFCMIVSVLLLLSAKINADFSVSSEVIFSMLSMTLFGYAACSSFKMHGAKTGILLLVAIVPIMYALLQILINFSVIDDAFKLVVFQVLAIIIANSSMAGLLILTSANMIQGSLEELLAAANAKTKKLENELALSKANSLELLATIQRLEDTIGEKDLQIQARKSEAGELLKNIYLKTVLIGSENNNNGKYFITFTFMNDDEPLTLKCINNKLTVPHSHWIVFALARKNGITLKHHDIAQTKFQMIKYLNSFSLSQKIQQEQVFRNNGGEFDMHVNPECILFEGIDGFSTNVQLQETFKKYSVCFGMDSNTRQNTDKVHQLLVELLKRS